jgi:hypothetical protein
VKHRENLLAGVALGAGLVTNPALAENVSGPRFHYHVECVGADGELKWVEDIDNLVTTAGKTDIVDKYFKGSAYTAAWFLGLAGAGTKAVGDTLASHAGWSEVNPYTGNRPAITFGTTAAGSNTATAVSYSITLAGPTTVAGAFVASVATGTSGVLYSAGDFAASRSVVAGDTLNVTVTVSVS